MPEETRQPITMDIRRIMSLLPHRYPFLLVDRVVECVPGDHIVAYKNVSFNEPFFQGHFPGLRIGYLVASPEFSLSRRSPRPEASWRSLMRKRTSSGTKSSSSQA